VALAVWLAACSSTMPPAGDGGGPANPSRYSLVFIIHGDGDYLYHDALGHARSADEEVVSKAQVIAEQNPNAEIFIFHQIKRRHVLFLIPRRDGRAYCYRNGRLLAETSYWRDQGEARFDPEVRIYRQWAEGEPRPPRRLLFYFGHELPEFNRVGYDASYPTRNVTVRDLAEAVAHIAGEAGKIDLLVLATCFGGTPHTIGALAPHARYIVASPDNLHRSYFDLGPLANLDPAAEAGAVADLADRFARHAFEQLTREVQTAVSVVVYDVNDADAYLNRVTETYDRTLTVANGVSPTALIEHCDCADDSAYALPGMSKGLTVRYRAPRFGRMKNEEHHSGWECLRIAE
jgi:hypothetical protein